MKHFLLLSKKKHLLLLFIAVILFSAGLYVTSTNAFKFAKAYFFYEHHKDQESTAKAVPSSSKNIALKTPAPLYKKRPAAGEELGELFIPKLQASLPIYHGTDEDELEKGVGHFADSVLPGEKDNSVLSGHRDTVFRELGKVGVSDHLIVTTSAGRFTYKIRKVRIVDADDRTVIVPKPRATLTVSTCYPFNFIGSAPKRYVLIANLIKTEKP
ncbi:class D sortase [Bacillus sp. FJAT-42376]|uniref:class D sortase n=1 Tax=Bacillus sp. FJAT-42376 TaxID=2014076 RepID=UPI000F50F7C6|nr:class D sortase [Bacillus sp. FJAT-42376]AZB44117.1 class D sortase [Bacillus sp. FJAT-42376]